MENEDRIGQRHVRVPRDLPQSPTPAQCTRDADPDRVRERTLHTSARSLKSNIATTRNSGHIKVSGLAGAIHGAAASTASVSRFVRGIRQLPRSSEPPRQSWRFAADRLVHRRLVWCSVARCQLICADSTAAPSGFESSAAEQYWRRSYSAQFSPHGRVRPAHRCGDLDSFVLRKEASRDHRFSNFDDRRIVAPRARRITLVITVSPVAVGIAPDSEFPADFGAV